MLPDISVVVITYNEEARVGDCLASILSVLEGLRLDVIVVDSASQDRTVEIARRFPVRVVRLRDGGPRRPSIGRHVGTMLTEGRLVLFVDGDSVLEPAWISPALGALESDPLLAGIAGASLAVLVGPEGETTVTDQYPGVEYDDPPYLSGSALYRRDALERVGGWNPYMCGHEEPELGARLRAAGLRLRRLRIAMTRHYPKASRETVSELVRRARRGYVPGLGQYARLALARGEGPHAALAPIARYLQFALLGCVGILTLATALLLRSSWPVVAWAVLIGAVFAVFAIRARSLRKPAYYFCEWALLTAPVLRGFLQRPAGATNFREFPVEFEVVPTSSDPVRHAG